MSSRGFTPSLEDHAEVRCLFVLHSVSDSSSMRAKRGDGLGLSAGIETGEMSDPGDTGYTRLRKYEREKARAKD